ncbi:MAG: FtsX-like permease family protein [Chitinophagaceae bacterium]
MDQKKILRKLIQTGQGRGHLIFSGIGMGLGILILLAAVQSYMDVNTLLQNRGPQKGMADFLVINKKITTEMMGFSQKSTFSPKEIENIRAQTFVKSVGIITSNDFKVSASAGQEFNLSTELFFEAVPDSFLDHIPLNWTWSPGENNLPIILSADFISLYNYGFALSQGLPQLSEKSMEALPITITISNGIHSEDFRANVVGFSDRIPSILVPKNFLDWANTQFGHHQNQSPSRLILKVDDPSNPAFVQFLKSHHYQTSPSQLKFSRARALVQSILTGISGFGILVILLALMIFSLYLDLMITTSKEEIGLILSLGYSPAAMGKWLVWRILPVYGFILLGGLVLISGLQAWLSQILLKKNLSINPLISVQLFIFAGIIFLFIYGVSRYSVHKSIRSLPG